MTQGTKQIIIGFGLLALMAVGVPLVWWFGVMRRFVETTNTAGAPPDMDTALGHTVLWVIALNAVGLLLLAGGITMIVLGAVNLSRGKSQTATDSVGPTAS